MRILISAVLLALLWLPAAYAQQSVTVAVIEDAPQSRLSYQSETIVAELLALTGREFDVELKRYAAEWTRDSIEQVTELAYSDADVDFVLVTGFVANQVLARRETFPKPTFLPLIIDTGLFDTAAVDNTSGIPNLNYLSTYADFTTDLDELARMVDYDTVTLLIDGVLSSSIPVLRQRAFAVSEARGITLQEVAHDGINHDLVDRLPPDTDAVFVAGLGRMPPDAFDKLIADIIEAGLPSYSFAGVADVESGLLMTNTEPRDINRLARLNALNMQAVMLGESAENQPVGSPEQERLTINLATARAIGLSPSFDILADAALLNPEAEISGEALSLADVARLALTQNQDLLAERLGTDASAKEIQIARAGLLPSLGTNVSSTTRKQSPIVQAGFAPERSNDAALSLSQVIWSDGARANVTIQTSLQTAREAALREFELDIVQAATTAYFRVLNARSQLRVQEDNLDITRANLDLAKDRVRLGSTTAADTYRWQAEVAQSRIGVVNARAVLDQAWDGLNRLLHRQPGTRVALKDAAIDEPFAGTDAEFDQLIRNQKDYDQFSRFFISRALQRSPELSSIDAQMDAKAREVTATKRAFWMPDISLSGQVTDNINQVGAGFATAEGFTDWSVGVQATLPLFAGGERRAAKNRAELEMRRLETFRVATEERVEEAIRVQLHAVQARYVTIDLAQEAAEASKKNLELISDAYARGTVNVVQLLDAQEASLNAQAAATDSRYDFLITAMALQRAAGGYDFLLSPLEKEAIKQKLTQTLSRNER